jgi:hypothetical protein
VDFDSVNTLSSLRDSEEKFSCARRVVRAPTRIEATFMRVFMHIASLLAFVDIVARRVDRCTRTLAASFARSDALQNKSRSTAASASESASPRRFARK